MRILSCETKCCAGFLDEEVLETTASSCVLMVAWVEDDSEVKPTVELGEATLSICPYLSFVTGQTLFSLSGFCSGVLEGCHHSLQQDPRRKRPGLVIILFHMLCKRFKQSTSFSS